MTTLYGLTTCDTCKKARKWLDGAGIAHSFVDYRTPPPSSRTLMEWAVKRGGFPAIINKASTTWRQLPEQRKSSASDDDWVSLVCEYPALIRRPVVVMEDGRLHQGFKEADFKTLFGVNA